jgi:hypothetical protein
MFYEDVIVLPGETVYGLSEAYGHKGTEWRKIWDDPRNAGVKGMRKVPEKLGIGDILWVEIPWAVTEWTLIAQPDGATMRALRDGEPGTRITWVQTVYQSNQPVTGTTAHCVDGCPADDPLPFYYTKDELKEQPKRRNEFFDYSHRRNPPARALGPTRWRAVLSVAVVTGQRVSLWDSQVWGWDMSPTKEITILGPRDATKQEVDGHINLLRTGKGTGPVDFGRAGWSFRRAK